MMRILSFLLSCLFLLALTVPTELSAAFDERLWEKYADIQTNAEGAGSLIRINLEPHQIGDLSSPKPFADFRIVSSDKEEIAWQIISRRPDRRREPIDHEMQNLSLTERGETWVELVMEKPNAKVNAVEIITPDGDFTRRVQVLGSADGQNWNVLRGDGIIFDLTPQESLRRTRITFPQTGFRHLALKIDNTNAQPLNISGINVWQENYTPEQTYTIAGTIEKPEFGETVRESHLIATMKTVFPIDRLIIGTPDRNFRRAVTVEIRRETGEWQHWAAGTILNFDTPTMREEQLVLDIPEVAAREFRLTFKNLDNPPVRITGVTGKGYKRVLVYRQSGRKMYLFWGNASARPPQYDLVGNLPARHLDALPVAYLGPPQSNDRFASNKARLPFTERYKYILYGFVLLVIAGLIFLQYRVFRNIKS